LLHAAVLNHNVYNPDNDRAHDDDNWADNHDLNAAFHHDDHLHPVSALHTTSFGARKNE
jgi:hypothetical protein